jgi:SAM-dependent methyltransferase
MSIAFTDDEILQTYYNKVKLPESYFTSRTFLPPCPVKRFDYSWRNTGDFPRNWCILDFIDWIKKYNIENINHLGFTHGEDPELEFIHSTTRTHLPYPPHDLHNLTHTNEFDFFMFNQTLEHLYNPFEAVKKIYASLKPGGYVFTSVPTLNIPHLVPFHFNGFTPMGLAMLFKTSGFDVLEIGQWGNYEYIQKLWASHGWPSYNDLEHNGCIANEENNVCQCWILAKKKD